MQRNVKIYISSNRLNLLPDDKLHEAMVTYIERTQTHVKLNLGVCWNKPLH